MLLVAPPLPREDWMARCLGDPHFRRLLCRYAETYQTVVLALPADRISRIFAHLVRGIEDCLANAESFHVVVERELRDHEAEPSGKAARLIVLAALGRSLADHVPLRRKTRRLLRLCEEVVPLVLTLAVNDRYAFCEEERRCGTGRRDVRSPAQRHFSQRRMQRRRSGCVRTFFAVATERGNRSGGNTAGKEHMDAISRTRLRDLAAREYDAAVTICMPRNRQHPAATEDAAILRSLVQRAEPLAVARGMSADAARRMLAPARELAADESFWRAGGADGLVVLAGPDLFETFPVLERCPESVDVGRGFRVSPLLAAQSREARFLMLALSPKRLRLLRCDRSQMLEEPLPPGVPSSLDEFYDGSVTEKSLQYHTSSGFGGAGSLRSTPHGHGDPRDDKRQLLDAWCHVVCRRLLPFLEAERLPLVVVGVEANLATFRSVCRCDRLLEQGVVGSPDELSDREMHRLAAGIADHWSGRALEHDLLAYEHAERTGRTSGDAAAIVPAAHAGRVGILFVARNARRPGTFDPASGKVRIDETTGPDRADLIEEAVRETLLHDGTAHVVEPDRMPQGSRIAAILRWSEQGRT